MNICASIKNLKSLKLECDPKLIRTIWKTDSMDLIESMAPRTAKESNRMYRPFRPRTFRREAINEIAGFHGVEYLGKNKRTGEAIYYLNAGDSYAPTIIFQGARLFVSTVGDLIEGGRVRTYNSHTGERE